MKIDIIKYLLRANFYALTKDYDNALYCYMKAIISDIKPTSKLIDYNLKIEKITDKICDDFCKKFKYIDIKTYESKKILILCSEIYDFGGHTEIALNYINSFCGDYKILFYLTNIFHNDEKFAAVKSQKIKTSVEDYYLSSSNTSYIEKIFELYNYIIENKITTINVNMHMNDVVACAVLYLVQKYTNINVIFWNHADHFYSLGTDYCDKLVTRCKNGQSITPYLINNKKVIQMPFLIAEKDYKCHDNIREKLNIPKDSFVTLTGCRISKLSDSYFSLIKKVLNENKNIYHILVTNCEPKIINKLQKKYKLNSERFILQNVTPYFDDYINASNLYIDSFPQGSALTLVDCIKYSVPVAVKINKEFPIKSFEEYLYPSYELASETEKGLFDIILNISNDLTFYKLMKSKVYDYFKNTYSLEHTLSKYEELIK